MVATGGNEEGQCNVADWRDIVAIAAGFSYTLGLRSDGTVVAAGKKQGNVVDWKLFDSIDSLPQELESAKKKSLEVLRKEAAEKAAHWAKRKAELENEKAALRIELSNLKGIFTGKRRKEIEARLAEIDTELKGRI